MTSVEHLQYLPVEAVGQGLENSRRDHLHAQSRVNAFIVSTGEDVEVAARIRLLVHEALNLRSLGLPQQLLDVRGILVEIILAGGGC